MLTHARRVLLLLLALVWSGGCGASIDLSELTVVDTLSGWYDDGVKNGLNRLVPTVTFRLENGGTVPADFVQLTVAFWKDGDDGEWGGREVVGIGADDVAPGASTGPILVRADVGYTLEQPRAELFAHSQFKDVTARILAKRDGNIVRIGEIRIDRRILPRTSSAGSLAP